MGMRRFEDIEHNPEIRLARRAVEAAAPEELPNFAKAVAEYHRPHIEERRVASGPGLEAVATLFSTAALTVSVQVLNHLTERASVRAAETVQRRVRSWFRRFRRRPPARVTARPLSAKQLTDVRKVAVKAARRLHVPEEQARIMADAIVAELATMTQDPADSSDPGDSTEGAGQ